MIVHQEIKSGAGPSSGRYIRGAGDAVALTGTWKVEFIEGGPVLPAGYETKELASWTTRDDPELKRFAGTARYTIEFEYYWKRKPHFRQLHLTI